MGPKVARNVAVLAFPFTSHPFSLLRFVRSVSNLAPDMQFTFFNTARSNSSLFASFGDISDDNIQPYNVGDGMPEGYTTHAAGYTPEHQVEMFGESAPSNFEKAIKEVEAETGSKFDLLISDAILCWFASVLAKRMHVTWVPFWASTQRCLLTFVEIDNIKEKMAAQGQEDIKSLDFLPGFSNEFQVSDLPGEIAYGKNQPPLAAMFHKMGQELPQATMVVINSFESIDLKLTRELKKKLKKFLLVGPQHLVVRQQRPNSDEDGCLTTWLDKHEHATVAYINFGTEAALAPMEVAALAEALEETRVPFVWSFRGNKEEFPQGFIDQANKLSLGKVVSWVDQESILNHPSVGVFLTHCGWGSILESITGGVPMIGKPTFADQYMNMRSIEVQWKIGVRIDGSVFTKGGAVKALEQVLLLEKGREMRKRAEILKHMALEAVGSDGSSTQDLKAFVDIITKS